MNKQILFLLLILLIVIININFKNEKSESFTSQKSKASFSKKDIKGTAGPLKQTFKIPTKVFKKFFTNIIMECLSICSF